MRRSRIDLRAWARRRKWWKRIAQWLRPMLRWWEEHGYDVWLPGRNPPYW